MAKKLKVGDVIGKYRITEVFGPGMMAISYAAAGPAREKVFLKQYKSPAPTVIWYEPYVAYQRELSGRVSTGRAAHFAVRQLDAFEALWGGRCYFQAYEFVDSGADLEHILAGEREQHRESKIAPTSDPAVWARRITWAKVLMAGIAALHDVEVVHADLKPANAYLLQDSSITVGYQLKLIDMDFSLLADRRAPWHGFQGYVGTDNYRSPEHLVKGGVPGLASDVFTCGLILHELLVGTHPYWQEDQGDYARLVQTYGAKPPTLAGRMLPPASNTEVSAALHRCLSPNPSERPTATELRATLSGRTSEARGRESLTATKRLEPSLLPGPAASSRPAILSDRLELRGDGGRALQVGLRTELGRTLVRPFGVDSEYWDSRQCVLDRDAKRRWFILPVAGATNETLVNGEKLDAARLLRQGDQIAVGRQAKGIVKLPLVVRGL